MKSVFLLLCSFCLFVTSWAQINQSHFVITPLGGYDEVGQVGISFTTGQVENETFETNNGMLIVTQGFQQPELIGVSIDDLVEVIVDYQVYPNPTPRILNVVLSTSEPTTLTLEFLNLLGQD